MKLIKKIQSEIFYPRFDFSNRSNSKDRFRSGSIFYPPSVLHSRKKKYTFHVLSGKWSDENEISPIQWLDYYESAKYTKQFAAQLSYASLVILFPQPRSSTSLFLFFCNTFSASFVSIVRMSPSSFLFLCLSKKRAACNGSIDQ